MVPAKAEGASVVALISEIVNSVHPENAALPI
jgi:hypothetical protein